MSTPNADVGSRIRALRRQNRIRQQVLARMAGLSPSALTNFELGKRRISLVWLERIAEVLNTATSYFLDGDGKTSQGRPGERRLLLAWRGLGPVLQQDFSRLVAHLAKERKPGNRRPSRDD